MNFSENRLPSFRITLWQTSPVARRKSSAAAPLAVKSAQGR